MEKIKSLLHPHGSDKDRETAGDVTHDHKGTAGTAAQAGTAAGSTAAPQSTPIYDQMTGHANTSSAAGETPKFSNTPNVGASTGTSTGTSTGLTGERHAGRVGTDGPIGGAPVSSSTEDHSRLGDSSHHSDASRPHVSSGAYDGNSEASIKSGVIGFTPGSAGQGHAAMPNSSTVEEKLSRNQIVGQGSTDSGVRNQTIHEQPSVLPVPSSAGHQQPHNSGRTTDTDRSLPLSGGTTHSSATEGVHGIHSTQGVNTTDRDLNTPDHHGRQGLAGAAAVAAGTAAATHGHHGQGHAARDHAPSPTAHFHPTTSVPEHNIHPEALHAAGVPPVRDSKEPGHGPPYETPHVNTGTLLDYEKAFGSDPHTKHTGLLDYRPHVHRSGTSPHVPGEFPGATPEHERSTPILGGAGAASSTTSTGPSTAHNLRHTGTLDDPESRPAEASGHHLGRDAAIAGGVGAAGLGAATHHGHETSGSQNLYDEKNPYSSKSLDPRVTGAESRLNEQRFDPSSTSATSRTQPLAGSAGPQTGEQDHHLGRNAAIGGGALGAGVLAGSALSSDRHHDPSTSSVPHTQNTSSVSNPTTFGTTGAPAPRFDNTTSTSHQSPTTGTHSSAPHSSNIANTLDPRVPSDSAKQTTHATTAPHQSDTLNRADPRVDDKAGQHHYGRDAAVAGGAGAAGYGAYEAAKAYGDHRSTQPAATMPEQRYDPTAAGARASNPVPATSEYNYHNPDVAALASATGAGAPGHYGSVPGQTQQPYTTAQMAQQAGSQPPQAYKAPEIGSSDLGPKDSSSRNAALGAGAGLAGATAVGYGLSQHGDNTHNTSAHGVSTQPGSSSLPQPTGSLTQGQQYPHNTDPSQSHTGRDAALAGGVGAAAGAGAGYAYGQRAQPQFDPKEQERLEKETAKRQHELEKKHDKDIHKLEKEREKDLKKHEKEAAHHDEKEKEKSGGLLGFLHRDKSKKDRSPESTPRRSAEHHYGRDAAVAGGAGTGAAGLAEHEQDKFGHGSGYKGKNLLHKDPPEGHPAREALHANNRVGVDGPIGTAGTDTSRTTDTTGRTGEHHYGRDAAVGGGALGAGALGAHELSNRDRTDNVVPSQHTGLSGGQTSTLPDRSSALGASGPTAHDTPSGKRTHIGTDGPIGDPNLISGDRETQKGVYGAHPVADLAQDRTVIEPRTGLPMNVGRYGDGAGGTDGGPIAHTRLEAVEGRVEPGTADREHARTDWEGVAKKDTIY